MSVIADTHLEGKEGVPQLQLLQACHCKNKLVVVTTKWLPWWQTSWRDSGYLASNPGFPFRIWSRSFGEKSEGKPGRISHVIRWHRDVNLPSAKATRHTECSSCVFNTEGLRCKRQNQVQGNRVTWHVGSLFTKRSYST